MSDDPMGALPDVPAADEATGVAAKAPADGYTLLMASSGPVTVNPLLQDRKSVV